MTDLQALPLVSVIISSYNHADYIEACIDSVLKQTYPNIELLVVDDGSRDDSVARIQALQSVYGFDFRSQANQGLSKTLNQAIERAKGSLIAPFGSDDIMLPERIAIQVAYMADKPEVGICAGGIRTIDAAGKPIMAKDRVLQYRHRLDFEHVFLNRKPGALAPTLLFRREALEDVGGFDPDIRLEDLMIELKITKAGYFIDILPKPLALYRVHGGNTYKNQRFMIDNVLSTYARFSDHPAYEQVCMRYRNSMFLKSSSSNKALARELLRDLPWRYWNLKTLKGIGRLLFRW